MLAVAGKHRKAVKAFVVGDLLQPTAVGVDEVKIEIAAGFAVDVGGKDDPLAVGMEIGRKAGFADIGDLADVLPVDIHHINLQSGGAHVAEGHQVIIIFQFGI